MKLLRIPVFVVTFFSPVCAIADITWSGGFYMGGDFARATSKITAERTDEVDALYAYSMVTEEGSLADEDAKTCLATGIWPLSCTARAITYNLTYFCEYCGSGEVKALRYNPNQTELQGEWGTHCDYCTETVGGCYDE